MKYRPELTYSPEHVHTGRIAYFDGWRGISMLLVLAGHFLGETTLQLASLGVELFFVLSGRLMADILFGERYPLPGFFRRRVSRIYPALVVYVLVTFAATAQTSLAFKPAAVLSALTFTFNYALVMHHGVAAIENLWSLCVEEHAYLFLGAIAFLSRRGRFNPAWLILAAAAASMVDALVCSLVLKQPGLHVYWRTDAHVCSILWAVTAYFWLEGRRVWSFAPLLLFAGAIAASAGAEPFRFAVVPILAGLAVCTLGQAPALVRAALSWPPLVRAGVWSYSIYLWQQPLSRVARDGHLPAWAAMALSVLCGILSFYLVEQPARRFLNARWRPEQARTPAPAPAPAPIGGSPA